MDGSQKFDSILNDLITDLIAVFPEKRIFLNLLTRLAV